MTDGTEKETVAPNDDGKIYCSTCGARVADITQHMLWHKSGGRYKVNQRWADSSQKRRGTKRSIR